MGQFSWLDCKTGEQILDNVARKTYVLVPAEFGGGHIEEDCYDGYGNFGKNDIYELVALWNRDFIPELLQNKAQGNWHCFIPEEDSERLQEFYEHKVPKKENGYIFELRTIGIYMACYDEDNERLPYPIKITHDKNAIYENCEPSKSDPNQGWKMDDDDYDDDFDDDYNYRAYYDTKTHPENMLLWNILKEHVGHHIEIAIYGDPDNPSNVCLEDMDTNEVILDAELYTLCARED